MSVFDSSAWKTVQPFVLGGASGMFATCVMQPIDFIKVQIQVLGEGAKGQSASPFAIFRDTVKNQGVGVLYKGLSAALLRQATYTTARLGIFRSMTDYLDSRPGVKRSAFETAAAGTIAGGLGAIVGTPADVALIRMQTDGNLPADQRRNYTGVTNALTRIAREEGVNGVFKGCVPVVVRAMALNLGMLGGHDEVLAAVEASTGNVVLAQFAAKKTAGFLASACSLPFDFVKTRLQKMKANPDGTFPYKNSIDCARKVLINEGPLAFYRGFPTYYVRIAPHAMITLLAMDAMTNAVKSMQTPAKKNN